MVNVLEALYVMTAIAAIVTVIYWLRGRRQRATQWGIATVVMATGAAVGYWLLST